MLVDADFLEYLKHSGLKLHVINSKNISKYAHRLSEPSVCDRAVISQSYELLAYSNIADHAVGFFLTNGDFSKISVSAVVDLHPELYETFRLPAKSYVELNILCASRQKNPWWTSWFSTKTKSLTPAAHLMQAIMSHFKKLKRHIVLWLPSHKTNARAIAFYTKFGFVFSGPNERNAMYWRYDTPS